MESEFFEKTWLPKTEFFIGGNGTDIPFLIVV
jgi:hypothetical protein